MNVEFTIPGKPHGKARPRVTVHGTYTPKATKDYESLVRAEYLRQTRGVKFPAGAALEMYVTAYCPIPKSASKAKRQAMENRELLPTSKPDLDNVFKAVADALNGVAYRDDAQLVAGSVRKYYSAQPRTDVIIFHFQNQKEIKRNA